MATCDPRYNGLALAAARRMASNLSLSKGSREEALRIVRKLERETGQ